MGVTGSGLRYPEGTEQVNQGHVGIKNLADDVTSFYARAVGAGLSLTTNASGNAIVTHPYNRIFTAIVFGDTNNAVMAGRWIRLNTTVAAVPTQFTVTLVSATGAPVLSATCQFHWLAI